jgi:hypothetical protein
MIVLFTLNIPEMKTRIIALYVLLALALNSYAQLDSGLVFYLPCNGNMGDSSISNRTPTIFDGPYIPVANRWGTPGAAMRKDSEITQVNYNDTLMRNDQFTISMWVYVDNINSNGKAKLLNFGFDPGDEQGAQLNIDGGDGYEFKTRTLSATVPLIRENPLAPRIGRWMHLFAYRDTNTMAFYINDTLIDEQSVPVNAKHMSWPAAYHICTIFQLGTQNITGAFDDIRVYNRVLITAERKALYNEDKILSLDKDTIDIAFAGGSENILVTSNTAWSVNSNQSWASVAPASGNGNDSITVTINSNPGIARNSLLTVTAGSLTKFVYIRQQGAPVIPDSLQLDKDSINAGNTASSHIVQITSNRSWLTNSNQPWATVTPSSGNGNGTIEIELAKNTGAARTVMVTVFAGTLSKTIFIQQQAGPPTGIKDLDFKPHVIVYPNPSPDGYIYVNTGMNSTCAVNLYDLTGRVVLNTSSYRSGELLNISSLRPGLYFIQVTSGNSRSDYIKVKIN